MVSVDRRKTVALYVGVAGVWLTFLLNVASGAFLSWDIDLRIASWQCDVGGACVAVTGKSAYFLAFPNFIGAAMVLASQIVSRWRRKHALWIFVNLSCAVWVLIVEIFLFLAGIGF